MKKFRFLAAALAVVLVAGSAFSDHHKLLTYKYVWVSTNMDGTYTVSTDISGQTIENGDYRCNSGTTCTVSTNTQKDGDNKVPQSGASTESGSYQDL